MLPVLLTQTIILFQGHLARVRGFSATDFLGAAAKVANRDYRLVEMYSFVAGWWLYFVVSYGLSTLVRQAPGNASQSSNRVP